jgi:hypothetical protein
LIATIEKQKITTTNSQLVLDTKHNRRVVNGHLLVDPKFIRMPLPGVMAAQATVLWIIRFCFPLDAPAFPTNKMHLGIFAK